MFAYDYHTTIYIRMSSFLINYSIVYDYVYNHYHCILLFFIVTIKH